MVQEPLAGLVVVVVVTVLHMQVVLEQENKGLLVEQEIQTMVEAVEAALVALA